MAFVLHLWRLLNLKLELPFQAHIVKSLNEINTCSRSGCLSVTNALNKSTSCTFERPYRVLESSEEEESLFRGLPSSRNLLRFWALALSLGSLSGVINTELASPSTSRPLLLLESSSELMFSSVSVEDWTNLCKEACLAVRFLRKLGASKETKMSLSGELSWPFSEEIEVRFVISFITDIIRRQTPQILEETRRKILPVRQAICEWTPRPKTKRIFAPTNPVLWLVDSNLVSIK